MGNPDSNPKTLAIRLFRLITKPLYWWYERGLKEEVLRNKIPNHLGIILDGHRRFAKSIGLDAHLGHYFGVEKAYEVLNWCLWLGIKNVTIWVLSTDNLKRPQEEVQELLKLLVKEAKKLAVDPKIHANRVKIKVIGRLDILSKDLIAVLHDLEKATANFDSMQLNIAVAYGGREEIVDAVKRRLQKAVKNNENLVDLAHNLDVKDVESNLYTAGLPDPDFIIRSSGEVRLGGFLLWQAAYSEYYFCDALWPEFRFIDFLRAIRNYQGRKRRFGK